MYLAVDIGGSKTLLAVFSNSGEIKEKRKFPTPPDYTAFLDNLSDELQQFAISEFDRAVVAVPGRLDRKHGVALAFGNLAWRNIPIQSDLERLVGCPVIIENDAKLAGVAEAHEIIHEFKKVLYITVSTGIGGALIVHGVIDPETEDMEIGSMLLEYRGELQRWEEFASGRAIYAKYGKKVKDITDPRAWYEIGRNLAIGLIDAIAAFTPEAIIIGGGVGTHLEKFKTHLEEQLKIYENPMLTIPPILQAAHPEEAVIYGCYQIAKGYKHAAVAR